MEMLVTIFIIGLLSTLATISLSQVRLKARNVARLSDIKQIQSALELYRRGEGHYPAAISFGQPLVGDMSSTTYMALVPSNMHPRIDGGCPDSNYIYSQTASGSGYALKFCLGNNNDPDLNGALIVTQSGMSKGCLNASDCGLNRNCIDMECADFVCGDDFIYLSEVYPTIQIGAQCWFAKSLNIGGMISGVIAQSDNSVVEKHCYSDNTANCETDGGLYQWAEAVQYLNGASLTTDWSPVPTGNVQGLCPSGWHIPSDSEFDALDQYLKDDPNACDSFRVNTWECANAGDKLKTGGLSGFNAILSGYSFNNAFYARGSNIGIWTASTFSASNAWDRYLEVGMASVFRSNPSRSYGFSVRCLKD